MFSYNTIINFTELVTSYVSHGKSFRQVRFVLMKIYM